MKPMRHWKAKRLLASLPDDTLPAETERAVRAHVAVCARCERRLARIHQAEALLQRLPASILPLEASPHTYPRLTRLAAWSEEPELPTPGRWRAPALGLASLVAVSLVMLSVRTWAPVMSESSSPVVLAYMPEDSFAVSVSWRPGR